MDNFVIVDGTDGMKLKYKYGDDLKIYQDLKKKIVLNLQK